MAEDCAPIELAVAVRALLQGVGAVRRGRHRRWHGQARSLWRSRRAKTDPIVSFEAPESTDTFGSGARIAQVRPERHQPFVPRRPPDRRERDFRNAQAHHVRDRRDGALDLLDRRRHTAVSASRPRRSRSSSRRIRSASSGTCGGTSSASRSTRATARSRVPTLRRTPTTPTTPTWTENVTGSFGQPAPSSFLTDPIGGGATFQVTDAPFGTEVPRRDHLDGQRGHDEASEPEFTATSNYKNHGDYVKTMGGGADAAHSCIGMPIVSRAT